jgi:Uma2 family endonuclease
MMLPMAPPSLWWQALQVAYAPEPAPSTIEAWETWSDRLEYDPDVGPAGPRGTNEEWRLYNLLKWSLWHIGESTGLGRSLGHDFVIRLGEDGFTPDLVFMGPDCLERLRERYLDGPPTLAIEITVPGSAHLDRELKRQRYEAAGVPEFWLVEPEAPSITFSRLGADGRYAAQTVSPEEIARIKDSGEEHLYHSTAAPGLTLSLRDLWTMVQEDRKEPWRPFLPVAPEPGERKKLSWGAGGIRWDEIPFGPRVALEPVAIRFDEYASWCGRAKFERYGDGIKIDGSEGARRVAGMLLMTFGLCEIVRLAHPREWVVCLTPERHEAVVGPQTEHLMSLAHYKHHDEPRDPYYSGRIPSLELWGDGDTREECEQDLTRRVREWLLLRIARREPLTSVE